MGRSAAIAMALGAWLVGMAGCADTRGADPFGSGEGGEWVETTAASSVNDDSAGEGPEATSTSSDGDDEDGDGMGIKFDTPNGETGDPDAPPSTGCEKVDVLFVIDNSGSMAGEQTNLIDSFPGFIAATREALEDADSYHVGITTTDAYLGNSAACRSDGALVTSTGGENSSAAVCGPYASGGAFMTDADNLDQTFACAGQVGTGGIPFERPMDTMRAAITPGMNAAGACNAGFVRDDALLVVVIITDEEDHLDSQVIQNGSAGEPLDWFNDLVALKGGPEQNIVVLALVGLPAPNACPVNGGDDEGAEVASRILTFTEMFTHGYTGDVCAPTYDAFFSQAISVIDLACEGFDPVG